MAFPETPRVIYEKNPLQEVVCQLDFPPILRIGSETPAEYQELIRGDYPLFEEETLGTELPAGIPAEIAKLLASESLLGPATANYRFTSADENWFVELARDSLTFTCQDYKRWEDFKAHLREPFEALLKVYSPAFFTRVRLTYSNIIDKVNLGLEQVEWPELLEPHIACELASNMSTYIQGIRSETLISLGDVGGQVLLRRGLAQSRESSEIGYAIESNFYVERTEIDAAAGILDAFNQQARLLFRWCIKDPLHKALGPRPG